MFVAVYTEPVTGSSQLSTLPVHERIAILKEKLLQNIQRQRGIPGIVSIFDSTESDYYERREHEKRYRDFLIPPINNPIKKKPKYKATTTTTVKSTAINKTDKGHTTQSHALRTDLNALLVTTKKKHLAKPVEVFYRRKAKNESKNMESKWAHCQDLVTPFLTGIKKDVKELKKVLNRDPIVVRLCQLLNENTTTYTTEETYSILYQINNLQLRFFQWDLAPIRALFNIIAKGPHHTFKNLKRGLITLLTNWRLDLTNTTNILQQTRIIRPLCTVTSHFEGSTKAQKVSKYKDWLTTPRARFDDEFE
ncbi:unnamed protein product [Parnassius mnemosyne]|uniref:Uncharacterized protein n=1 Tax=Parnassius mnemosyne TaxID=213953 RepID=A0AAV1LE63_9NEOP